MRSLSISFVFVADWTASTLANPIESGLAHEDTQPAKRLKGGFYPENEDWLEEFDDGSVPDLTDEETQELIEQFWASFNHSIPENDDDDGDGNSQADCKVAGQIHHVIVTLCHASFITSFAVITSASVTPS
ncbi:hypothetical protein DL96DRAFT_1722219 [Flagelloscypha sp. PMI_526]|nr:hypothetical protein DL96DRAFT_1722219 [Flagelloscypha sp. PMI_526]